MRALFRVGAGVWIHVARGKWVPHAYVLLLSHVYLDSCPIANAVPEVGKHCSTEAADTEHSRTAEAMVLGWGPELARLQASVQGQLSPDPREAHMGPCSKV
jgi:hypothetical protein